MAQKQQGPYQCMYWHAAILLLSKEVKKWLIDLWIVVASIRGGGDLNAQF